MFHVWSIWHFDLCKVITPPQCGPRFSFLTSAYDCSSVPSIYVKPVSQFIWWWVDDVMLKGEGKQYIPSGHSWPINDIICSFSHLVFISGIFSLLLSLFYFLVSYLVFPFSFPFPTFPFFSFLFPYQAASPSVLPFLPFVYHLKEWYNLGGER